MWPLRTIAFLPMLTGSLLLTSAAAPPAEQAETDAVQRCLALSKATFGPDVRIDAATPYETMPVPQEGVAGSALATATMPAHCRIEGMINHRVGADGKAYGIGFSMALPFEWSGRFLLQGGGGLNGTVYLPLGHVASDGRHALSRGLAVLAHDSGHKGAGFDSSFMADQRAALDFAETSVHTVTVLGKQIATAFYGQRPKYSYMTGCSTGGREGMLAFQRYPEHFDGIIVGAPAMRAGESNLGIKYTQVLMNQVAPTDANGLPDVRQLLTADVRQTLLAGILDQCDGLDGLEDGMIENVAACRFQPEKLACTSEEGTDCINPELAAALSRAFKGPYDIAGYQLYTPVPFDTGVVELQGGYLPTGEPGPLGPPSTATSIDLDAEIHRIHNNPVSRLTSTRYWTNLNTYLGRGGKILFFHGVSDFWFSPWATWDYYQAAAEENGTAFTDASRFYMVPGMMHCSRGNSFDQFDLLGPLMDWVENGEAPGSILAHRREPAVDHTRPLCPYPQYAAYKGGDPTKAESFACSAPTG